MQHISGLVDWIFRNRPHFIKNGNHIEAESMTAVKAINLLRELDVYESISKYENLMHR